MNETYVECLVACKKNQFLSILKYILYGFAIACFIWSFMSSMVIVFFVAALAFAAIAHFVIPMADIEYEYLYLDKELTIDKVIAKERRKRVMVIDLNKVEKIVLSQSHELDSYKARGVQEKDFSSKQADAKTYTMILADGGTQLIRFEPDEELINAVKTVFPRKIVEY